MTGTTRIVVDVPDELLARARANTRDYPGWGDPGDNAQTRIARLVVDAAPAPVEVTITLTAKEAEYLSTEWYPALIGNVGGELDRDALRRLAAALRAQGYGA